MSFPAYHNYKDSGVEWLPEVPSHWQAGRLRWLATIYSGGTPDKKNEDYWTDGTVPWLNSGAVNQQLVTEPSTYITEDALENSSAKWVPEDGLVIALAGQGKTKGMVAQLAFRTTCNQSMAAIIPHGNLNARFLFWWLTSNYQNIRNLSGGDLRDGLNLQLLGTIGCSIPDEDEQKAISSFLDIETSKIDRLVLEQRRLIELLKEKRQAVISHAVTKGLNPNAPMKPTGIRWLGDVPQHWVVARLGHFATIENGSTPSRNNLDYWDDGTFPWVSSGEVNQYHITEPSELITQAALDECPIRLLPVGTIVIGMIGQGKTRGLAAILKIEATINQNLAAIVTGKKLESVYLHYIFQSVYDFLREFGRGGQQAALNCEILGATQMPVPPVSEQQAICDYLDDRLVKFDSLEAEAERAIELLQERRTALISAAVTGKIDVRQLATEGVVT